MKLPTIQGVIRRRVLVNYRIIPEVMQEQLPARFRPKLHQGFAIGGICLIRLEKIRPPGVAAFLGASSENAAHRVAVLWEDETGATREGVYIPRRDTDSRINRLVGGRLFPGEHHGAKFRVEDDGNRIDIDLASHDKTTVVQVRGQRAPELDFNTAFVGVAEASQFFETGSLGYSATRDGNRFEGIRLHVTNWQIEALKVDHHYSSYFSDQTKFPPSSVIFDSALIMRDIPHEWMGEPDLPA